MNVLNYVGFGIFAAFFVFIQVILIVLFLNISKSDAKRVSNFLHRDYYPWWSLGKKVPFVLFINSLIFWINLVIFTLAYFSIFANDIYGRYWFIPLIFGSFSWISATAVFWILFARMVRQPQRDIFVANEELLEYHVHWVKEHPVHISPFFHVKLRHHVLQLERAVLTIIEHYKKGEKKKLHQINALCRNYTFLALSKIEFEESFERLNEYRNELVMKRKLKCNNGDGYIDGSSHGNKYSIWNGFWEFFSKINHVDSINFWRRLGLIFNPFGYLFIKHILKRHDSIFDFQATKHNYWNEYLESDFTYMLFLVQRSLDLWILAFSQVYEIEHDLVLQNYTFHENISEITINAPADELVLETEPELNLLEHQLDELDDEEYQQIISKIEHDGLDDDKDPKS